MKAVLVVFGWAALNAVLVLVMLPYGESALFIGMYGAGVAVITLFGVVVWLVARAAGWQSRGARLATASLSSGFVALAAILVGLSFVYGYWFAVFAGLPLIAAAYRLSKERLPQGMRPTATAVPTLPAERTRAPSALTRPVKAVASVFAAVTAARSLRPSRRARR
ncbi:putative membrane protein [Saccharomonospora amisosensis]|uniref:Putative membrane protein n=1 Tax=Saccharomonospora amisosensis TaxID=1128677 RepID=A0A7X5UPK6_9PSEU|nr:hypothetical protein [Saccharomonospora amisosensis]NIJ11852.1 putative membrane protein [Saccharomonospora amisosensis]